MIDAALVALFKMAVEWAEKVGKQHKEMAGKEDFNAVIRAMYELSEHGERSVTLTQLTDAGFRKMQVFNTIEQADARGWVIDCATHNERYDWLLNSKGCLYVEALLEEDGL